MKSRGTQRCTCTAVPHNGCYYALCALQGNGFDNVINISGSFLGISLYEYFNDKKLKREPIVTAYNFE